MQWERNEYPESVREQARRATTKERGKKFFSMPPEAGVRVFVFSFFFVPFSFLPSGGDR